jgi:hypothetical protein
MKRSLKKTSVGVSVTYSTGNFSNNLTGTDFTIEAEDDIIEIGIDLSCNLKVKNKESNCFYDANELAEDHSLLKSIQIDDDKIIDGLSKANKKYPDAVWKLELSLGDKGIFKYTVSVSGSNGSVFFNIEEHV